jgi:GNAT superfamily N-acetyltransferase
LVFELTSEISEVTQTQLFDISLKSTIERCRELIREGHYAAIIGEYQNKPIAVVTMTENYALYTGGKIGVIQEFYVSPEYRSSGVGAMLIKQVTNYAKQHRCLALYQTLFTSHTSVDGGVAATSVLLG